MSERLHKQLEALLALRTKATDERLDDDGRYFADGYGDLTECTHGETGNYRNRHDGKVVAILWNLWKDGALRVAGFDARSAALEEAAAVADRRATALRKMRGFHHEAAELETLAAAIRSLGSAPSTSGASE